MTIPNMNEVACLRCGKPIKGTDTSGYPIHNCDELTMLRKWQKDALPYLEKRLFVIMFDPDAIGEYNNIVRLIEDVNQC